MKKLRSFFEHLRSSFYDPHFYISVRDGETKRALVFLFALCLIGSFVIVIRMSLIAIPAVNVLFSDKFLEEFPSDLQIVIKDGKASTNVTEPFMISALKDDTGVENTLVIDTGAENSLDLLEKYRAHAVLTKTHIIVGERDKQVRAISLSNFPNMTVSRATVHEWLASHKKYFLPFFAVAAVVVLIAITIFSFIGYVLVLLFLAAAALLVGKAKKIHLSYVQSYRTAVYALAPAIIIDIITDAVGFYNEPWWLIFLLFLIVAGINIQPAGVPAENIIPPEPPHAA